MDSYNLINKINDDILSSNSEYIPSSESASSGESVSSACSGESASSGESVESASSACSKKSSCSVSSDESTVINEYDFNDNASNTSDIERAKIIEDWIKDMSSEDMLKLEPLAYEIYDTITENPKPSDILKSKMPFVEKCRTLEQIISMNSEIAGTDIFYQKKKEILNKIKAYNNMKEDSEALEKIVTNGDKLFDVNQDPMRMQILKSDLSDYNKSVLLDKLYNLELMTRDDKYKIREWIEWGLKISDYVLPLEVGINSDSLVVNKYLYDVKQYMDKNLFGMEKAKEKLLEILAMRITNENSHEMAIALCGPPGVGKTQIVQVFAEAVKQPFVKINMGGETDSHYFLGHSYTYEGSTPGILIKAMANMKWNNKRTKSGIIFFDEFDKIGLNSKIGHAFLHISDYTQQNAFQDNYMPEIKVDMSNMIFVYSLNDKKNIDKTLSNRLPIIDLPGYKKDEKLLIIKNFIIPKVLKNVNMEGITFQDEAINYILSITETEDSDGLRKASHIISDVIKKINAIRCSNHQNGFKIFKYHIDDFKLPFVITKNLIDKFDLFSKENNTYSFMYL